MAKIKKSYSSLASLAHETIVIMAGLHHLDIYSAHADQLAARDK